MIGYMDMIYGYMVYMEYIICKYITYHSITEVHIVYHRIDDALCMESITTVWPPPKAAATPLLWTQAPKAPASYVAYAVRVVYCMS